MTRRPLVVLLALFAIGLGFSGTASAVAAAKDAAQAGRGAFLLDGRMIDLPFVKRAEAVLAAANDSSDRL